MALTISVSHAAREDFGTWSRACVNSRVDTLMRDSVVHFMAPDGCNISIGVWVDPYSGLTFTDPSKLDVDHIVPLNHAYQNGANLWDQDRRVAFANDPRNLITVSASENRSKRSSTPATWMPSNLNHWCQYIESWIAVKMLYDLPFLDDESTVLAVIGRSCAKAAQNNQK